MKLIVNLLLMATSILLFVIVAPLGVMITIVLLFIRDPREMFEKTPDYPFSIAFSIDMLGNVVAGDLFNIILIKKGGYKFGRKKETISSAIGKNILLNKLTLAGRGLNTFLNLFEKHHALKSIDHFDFAKGSNELT
jgi:8-oxo-dGTP diphosphatase